MFSVVTGICSSRSIRNATAIFQSLNSHNREEKVFSRTNAEIDKGLDKISTREIEKEIKEEIRNRIRQAHKQAEENKEKKQLKRVKAGQYQVITDTTKIRKYDKKALSKVIKMAPDMIDSLLVKGNSKLGSQL